MENMNHTMIGHIIDVQGNLLIATLIEDEQGQLPIITIGDEDILIGQIGSYVSIRQNQLNIVAIITRMIEQEHFSQSTIEVPGDQPAGIAFAKRILRLTPIGTIDNEKQFERGISKYPTTGAEVHAIASKELSNMFSKFQSTGFSCGTVSSLPNQRVYLDPSNLFGRHSAILGQTGSGKSWTVTSIIQNTISCMPNAHIILLDLHGEYCWKENNQKKYAFSDSVVRHIDARELEIPYWLLNYSELCDLLIDQSEYSAHNQISVFREALGKLRESEGASIGLERTTVDTPVYFDLFALRDEIEEKNGMVTSPSSGKQIKGSLTGAFDNFLMRLDSKLNDIRYDFLLKPKHRNSSDSLIDLLRDFIGIGDKKSAVTIIDLSSVPFDVRPTIAAQIGRISFEFNYWNPKYREFPILLVCEEAHAYIPREKISQFAGARKSMERIAKEGRKYGVGLSVVSQRPHEVSETVLAQCGTFICLRITNPEDQNYIKSLVPESEGDLTSLLAGLGRGEAIILGEAIAIPSRMIFDQPNPTPNSDDIDYYKYWSEDIEPLDVEKIVNRWWKQEK